MGKAVGLGSEVLPKEGTREGKREDMARSRAQEHQGSNAPHRRGLE